MATDRWVVGDKFLAALVTADRHASRKFLRNWHAIVSHQRLPRGNLSTPSASHHSLLPGSLRQQLSELRAHPRPWSEFTLGLPLAPTMDEGTRALRAEVVRRRQPPKALQELLHEREFQAFKAWPVGHLWRLLASGPVGPHDDGRLLRRDPVHHRRDHWDRQAAIGGPPGPRTHRELSPHGLSWGSLSPWVLRQLFSFIIFDWENSCHRRQPHGENPKGTPGEGTMRRRRRGRVQGPGVLPVRWVTKSSLWAVVTAGDPRDR